jgi:hypothetical protein
MLKVITFPIIVRMKRYAANPQKSESLPGASKPRSVQLTSELYRLTGKITPFDAKEFQTMFDKQGAEAFGS